MRRGGERLGGGEETVAEGVTVRINDAGERTSIRIAFQYRGATCRERLAGLEVTPANIKYAIRRRGEVLNKIARGEFNYADEFPDSDNARRFGSISSTRTVGDLFDAQEPIWRGALEASTWYGYHKVIERHLRPWFEKVRIVDLTPGMIQEQILAVEGISLKTARNVLSPLRALLEQAVAHGELTANPLDRVKLNVIWPKERRATDWEPDPFAFEEMQAIFAACHLEEEADYWSFAFGTGMRPSEQIALPWPKVHLAENRVRVELARVTGIDGLEEKGPKTKAGNRWIDLTAGARKALERQEPRTGSKGSVVFLDARYGLPWAGETALRKRFMRLCAAAKVRYRNPYQTRHTFASVMLAAGVPAIRVARWMGHVDAEMLHRHYARWIEQGSNPATRAALEAFFSHPSPTGGEIVALPL